MIMCSQNYLMTGKTWTHPAVAQNVIVVLIPLHPCGSPQKLQRIQGLVDKHLQNAVRHSAGSYHHRHSCNTVTVVVAVTAGCTSTGEVAVPAQEDLRHQSMKDEGSRRLMDPAGSCPAQSWQPACHSTCLLLSFCGYQNVKTALMVQQLCSRSIYEADKHILIL